MTLRDLISTLANKSNVQCIIKSSANVELINLKASGYAALEDVIENSDVISWAVVPAQNSITVTIDYPQTTNG